MSKFLLSDRDFESVKANVKNSNISVEIRKIDNDAYTIFEHIGDSVFEGGTFSKIVMKTIWQMLTTEK